MKWSLRMIPSVPLPDWRALLMAMWLTRRAFNRAAEPWLNKGELVGWFSKSAWSLAQIVLWRRSQLDRRPVIWVPDFFCNATLSLVRATDAHVIFYPVTAQLQPDFAVCRQLGQNKSPDLFVLVHYFGAPAIAAPAREFCRHVGAWLIEDAAHVLKPGAGIGEYGDFVLYSPHKLLPIPDGALLVVRPNGPAQFGQDGLLALGVSTHWAKELRHQPDFRHLSLQGHRVSLSVWLLKRVLQKVGFRLTNQCADFVDKKTECHARNMPIPMISSVSLGLLARLNLAKAARWRYRNMLLWDDMILNSKQLSQQLTLTERPVRQAWIPYLACYEIKDVSAAADVYRQLQQLGLPVMTWPDLPEVVFQNQDRHAMAWTLRHQRIYLPIHQSIRPKQIIASMQSYQFDRIQTECPAVQLAWECVDAVQWDTWLREVTYSNLLQSYEYGQAKARAEGWQVQRGVFRIDSKPIAIVQVLKKRVAGMLTVYRVSRGPLYLGELDDVLRAKIIQCLSQSLSAPHFGRIFSFTPELPLSGQSIALLSHLGIRQFNPDGWESISLNLSLSESTLRHALHGKWRNMLVYAEKQDMVIRLESDVAAHEWLLERCNKMMIQRKKSKLPSRLYRILRQELVENDKQMLVFRAFVNDDIIAGIGIAPHGDSATYLLGWNGDVGRSLKANQRLLWHAILYLKQHGFLWFDLGGTNQDEVPGISLFKQGLGGEPYSLIGSGWKYRS